MIPRGVKTVARHVLPAPIFRTLKQVQRRMLFARTGGFSEEESLVAKYLDTLPLTNRYCVDIAAQDGIGGSQTLSLFKQGWEGIAVERDAEMFSILSSFYEQFDKVSLVRTSVGPHNAASILHACSCPSDFAFLSLDIDSYDYFVLERILAEFRPRFMCVEINEVVPPPLAFTVAYSPNHVWHSDHFQGQSIMKCNELCVRHNYDIVELHYNNLFVIPREINPHRALLPTEAYDAGYRNKPDRRERFPWNADMEAIMDLPASDAIAFLNRHFAKYNGKYLLG